MGRTQQTGKTALHGLSVYLLLACADTHGGPPLITDDPGTPGNGRWEINIASTLEALSSGARIETALLDINYGLGEQIQLKYEVPWVLQDETRATAGDGFGNSEVGLKYRFLDDPQHRLSMSVYPQIVFNSSTLSNEQDQPSVAELVLPVQLAWSTGLAVLNVEAGYGRITHEENEWFYGLAGGWPVSEHVELVAEVHGVTTGDFEEDEMLINVGGVFQLRENVRLLFSAGRRIRGTAEDAPERFGYLGVQLTGG